MEAWITWSGDSSCQKTFLVLGDDFAILGVNVDHAAQALAVVEHVHQLGVAQHQSVLKNIFESKLVLNNF